tara:strand:+ start:123 stop:479 length:357 start_codon:yes stop_codon:yes gene_type:complete
MLEIDYKLLDRKEKEQLATLCYTQLVDGFDLYQQEFSLFYPMRYWTTRIDQLVRIITSDVDIIISDNQYARMTRSLFDIMFKDNEWFYKDTSKPLRYVIDINKRADLQLTNSLFYSSN